MPIPGTLSSRPTRPRALQPGAHNQPPPTPRAPGSPAPARSGRRTASPRLGAAAGMRGCPGDDRAPGKPKRHGDTASGSPASAGTAPRPRCQPGQEPQPPPSSHRHGQQLGKNRAKNPQRASQQWGDPEPSGPCPAARGKEKGWDEIERDGTGRDGTGRDGITRRIPSFPARKSRSSKLILGSGSASRSGPHRLHREPPPAAGTRAKVLPRSRGENNKKSLTVINQPKKN